MRDPESRFFKQFWIPDSLENTPPFLYGDLEGFEGDFEAETF